MGSKQYDVTIPTTLYVTVRVSVDDDDPNADDPNDCAVGKAYEVVGGSVYHDCQGGIATQGPAVCLRFDDEFHNPWDHQGIDVVEVENQ